MTTDPDAPDPDAALVEAPTAIDREEVRRVLGLVMHVDGRHRPDESTVTEWLRLATLARWTYSEALDAVRAHYAVSTEYLMPGHVTARIRAARETRRHPPQWRRRSEQTAASDEARAGAMASIRATFATNRARRQADVHPDPEENSTDA